MGENALSRLVTSVKKYQESQQDTIEPAQKPEVKPVAKPEDKRPWKTILLVAALALVLVYALVMTFKQPKTTEPEADMTEMKEEIAEEKEEKPIVAAVENKEAEKPVVKEEKSVETPKPAKKTVVSDVSVKVNGVVFDMIAVRGGTFEMGATSEQAAYASDNESPKHKVTLDDFRIGKYEVTQKQWEAVMGSKGYWKLLCTNFNNQAGVNTETLKKVKIPLPPKDIQDQIATELMQRRRKANTLRKQAIKDWAEAKARFERELLGE